MAGGPSGEGLIVRGSGWWAVWGGADRQGEGLVGRLAGEDRQLVNVNQTRPSAQSHPNKAYLFHEI